MSDSKAKPEAAITRRKFVSGAAAVAVAGLTAREGVATELPKISEDDPTAQALKYVHDATTVDAALRPDERNCSNCALYSGADGAEWGPCSIFPGKAVNVNGWCSVWAPKAAG